MRRALRRAALALVAAGTPGLAMPAVALAQSPAPASALPPADAAREGRFRLEEMKVEMAWLADPATFPYPLAARSVEGNLELRGSMPTESLRQHALKVARAHTHLAVINLLQIDARLHPSESGVDSAAIRQGTVEVLNDAFGMAARGFDIRAEADGKVAVNGSVNSVEEKLAVSRKLRKVRGCTYASNYLQISPEMRDGRMVTRINAAGTLVVPGQVLCLDGTGQEPSTPNLAPVVPLMAAPARPVAMVPVAPPVMVTKPATAPAPVVVTTPAPKATVVTQTAQQPAAIRPVAGQTPVAPASVAQAPSAPLPVARPPVAPPPPLKTASVPAAAMPLEIPVPKIVMPVPPPMQPLASDRVPPPSKVPGQFDLMVPGPVQAQTRPTAQPATTAAASVAPSNPIKQASGAGPEKSVDLLATPTVPESWTKDAPASQSKAKTTSSLAVKQASGTGPEKSVRLLATPTVPESWTKDAPASQSKPKATSSFAVSRTPPPLPPTTDELLKLPEVPSAATQKQATKAVPVVTKPATDTRVTEHRPAVGPVPAPSSKDTKAVTTTAVTAPAKPVTTVAVQPQAPALKPLPTPPATPFKDTWVEALPAPKPAPKADHPQAPPGGWPSAHLSRPAPTAYVTSGVVVFQEEPVSVAKPARPAAPVVENKVEAKPTTQLVSRLEPVSPQPAARPVPPPPAAAHTVPPPQPAAHPATTFVVDRTSVAAGAPVTAASAAKIKQQVERVCGRLAKQVEILTTDKGLTVHVKCADAAAAQKITDRVLTDVPEMADTKVKFEVEVVR